MDENKLYLGNFFKLVAQNNFFEENHVLREQGHIKLPQGTIMFPREKGAQIAPWVTTMFLKKQWLKLPWGATMF
jgi:hypothetical protein